MDEVISDHVAWDDWEEWSKIMEEVDTLTYNDALLIMVYLRPDYFSISQRT